MRIRPLLLLLLLALCLALAGCGKKEEILAAETPPEKIVRVELLRVEPRNMVEEFTLPGSLEAWQDLLLAAEISGPVEKVGAEEGARVHQGQALVQIDTLTLQANRDRARSEFELRRKTAERLKKLHDEQLVSSQEYDNAVSALEMAKSSLRSAEIMLEKGLLQAPIDGLLEERFVDPGEYVGVGDPLVRVVQIDRLKVNVDVPEKDIRYLHKGDIVKLDGSVVGGWKEGTLKGKITHLGYVADAQTRTYRVRIEIDNAGRTLRPGMILRAHFARRHLDQVLVVPLYAVVEREGRKFLFLQEGDIARQRQVQLGATLNGDVVIQEGLRPGDRVVIKGQQLLIDKVRIQVGEEG